MRVSIYMKIQETDYRTDTKIPLNAATCRQTGFTPWRVLVVASSEVGIINEFSNPDMRSQIE